MSHAGSQSRFSSSTNSRINSGTASEGWVSFIWMAAQSGNWLQSL